MPQVSLDIQGFIRTATFLAAFFGLYTLWRSRSTLRDSDELPYHRLRQQAMLRGWQGIFWSFVLFGFSALLYYRGEAAAYSIFPVTDTPTLTATPSLTYTATLSPTITPTPTDTATLQFTYTPTPTPVPQLPASILAQFTSVVTPNPQSVFSPLTFARGINLETYLAVNPGVVFQNPVSGIYAIFSYDFMQDGVQWTAVWYRDEDLVHFETKPWDGGTGGLGYTEWLPDAEHWLPGIYQVVIFVGNEAKVAGEFEVLGPPGTSSPTPIPPTATSTRTNTPTITPTHTRVPTATAVPTK